MMPKVQKKKRPQRSKVQYFKDTLVYSNWKEFKYLGYQLGKKIGEGTNGFVMEAEYKGQKLVCKYMREDLLTIKGRNRFLPREIEICQMIDHPYIIKTHSIMQEHKYCYIFMERAKTDLLVYIEKNGVLKITLTQKWFSQVVSAIRYLHSMDIAHRDLKLENIFVTEDLTIKLGDFGYSCFVTNKSQTSKSFKYIKSKTFCGSRAYVAPEILKGIPYYPLKADIWSLGVVLSCMLYGVMPFAPEDSNLLDKMLKREMNVREEYVKIVPKDCHDIIDYTIDPNPNNRYDIEQIAALPWLTQLE
ncbi:hypothetical protein PVAND_005562 [Polypedilum vanderplanki]|uniref:Protein kinase domain-containing protein n=1 Tax=Polypedilum vanderplanki TaxID=319348 RepID=A0A9J6C0J5_POLVA|nr:hypothetical protein PVAND_005562 [Polypedilum vanderplanki]